MNPPPLKVTCALIRKNRRILLARRADNGLWEMPGGKVKPGESLEQCLAREIKEELGCDIEVLEHVALARGNKGPLMIHLHMFSCRIKHGAPLPLEHLEIAWASVDDLASFELCPLDRELTGRLHNKPQG